LAVPLDGIVLGFAFVVSAATGSPSAFAGVVFARNDANESLQARRPR